MKTKRINVMNIPVDLVWNPERESFIDEETGLDIEIDKKHSAEVIELNDPETGYKKFMLMMTVNSVSSLVHESWHLFFKIMNELDDTKVSFATLASEIYAYRFQEMIDEIYDSFRNDLIGVDKIIEDWENDLRERQLLEEEMEEMNLDTKEKSN